VRRTEFTRATPLATWEKTADRLYLYDGWNVMAEYNCQLDAFDTSSAILVASLLWGVDLSESPQGAGGVGGLLGIKNESLTQYFIYDGNGNVSEVLDANGSVQAHYEYDPFGNLTAITGAWANTNIWRFSTKPFDTLLNIYYYGYRFYDSIFGRWPNRDPMEENGGSNIYSIVKNDAIGQIDIVGLAGTAGGTCPCDKWVKIADFKLTAYNIASEKDYMPLATGDRMYRPKGLDRDYSYNFMIDVDKQGSGVSADGKFIKLVSKKSEIANKIFRYDYVASITGKAGRSLIHDYSIAVDTKVIALGTVVCVEGYGEKRADDTGGGVTGHHIDMFLNIRRKDALAFGTKDGIAVYKKK
jgi:RHS repeat-associated protein